MKIQICGVEGGTPTSKKTGLPFEVGSIHSLARLAAPFDSSSIAKGYMGTTYRCPLAIIKSIEHLPVPFVAEIVLEDVMRFGKREQEVISVTPEKLIAK